MVQPTTVDFLLARGADPNHIAYSNQTPLHLAIHRNAPAIAQKLLAAGAESNHKDAFGHTPLDWAHLYGRTLLADLLKTPSAQASVAVQTDSAAVVKPEQPRRVPVGPLACWIAKVAPWMAPVRLTKH